MKSYLITTIFIFLFYLCKKYYLQNVRNFVKFTSIKIESSYFVKKKPRTFLKNKKNKHLNELLLIYTWFSNANIFDNFLNLILLFLL